MLVYSAKKSYLDAFQLEVVSCQCTNFSGLNSHREVIAHFVILRLMSGIFERFEGTK